VLYFFLWQRISVFSQTLLSTLSTWFDIARSENTRIPIDSWRQEIVAMPPPPQFYSDETWPMAPEDFASQEKSQKKKYSKRFIFNFFRRNTIWNCHASVLFVFIFKPISFAVRYVPKIGNELLRDFPHYANVSFLWFRMYISPTHIGHAVGTPINKIFVASFWARLSGR